VTLEASLAWLYSTQQFGIKLGLDNIRRLLDDLGRPQDGLAFFHVAGTNGKGSVCAMLDSILRQTGKRIGLYTSPHLVDFGERIRVDGEKIPPEAVAEGLSRIRELTENWEHSPTFFEIATALALRHFADRSCDFVVLETGLGGRLDATNAVTPLVSVITPIALDHTQWLGTTLAEIAGEKAGIIKPGVPVVSAMQSPEVEAVLCDQAQRNGSGFFVGQPTGHCDIGLKGAHQQENAAVAVSALWAAGVAVSEEQVSQGLREVQWPGRFQLVRDRIILDGSHNPHASAHLVEVWRETYGDEKATVIFGALSDKDYLAMLKNLEPIASEFRFVPVRNPRSVDPSSLVSSLKSRVFPSVAEALETAEGRILVTGSLFLVGEAMAALEIAP
jgi:dihydrofolate synthase/folylpolyglutamate synthase